MYKYRSEKSLDMVACPTYYIQPSYATQATLSVSPMFVDNSLPNVGKQITKGSGGSSEHPHFIQD